MEPKVKISAVIPIKNEESRILRQHLMNIKDFFDEIIVIVDDQTTDNSFNICREFTDKVYYHQFKGIDETADDPLFAGIGYVSNKWFIILEADMVLSSLLKNEIKFALENEEFAGYRIPTCNFIFGKWFIHKEHWYPHFRLFNKDKVTYTRTDIHGRQFEFDGETRMLDNPIFHYGYPEISFFMNTMERYTELDKEKLWENRKGGVLNRDLIDISIESIKNGFNATTNQYFEDISYKKEGEHGYIYSALQGLYRFVEDAKVWELNWRKNNPWVYGDLNGIEDVALQIADLNNFPEKYDESYIFKKQKSSAEKFRHLVKRVAKGLTPPYVYAFYSKVRNRNK